MSRSAPDPVDIHELLDHASWVRSLALRLARNEDEAEDLVQDAWVAALRSPPEAGVSVRSWLATVLRNLNTSRHRSRQSRSRREARQAAAAEPPDPAEVLERASLQARLVQEVLNLEEIYREVVLLRYFEGQSLQEVAATTGLASETVRKRLQRAVERLRRRLAEDWGSDWRRRCVVLAGGLARVAPEAARVPAAGLLLAGGLAAGAAAWMLWGGPPGPVPAPAERPAVQEARAQAPRVRGPLTRRPGEEAPPDPALAPAGPPRLAPGLFGWTGVVLGPGDRPVPFARVHALVPEFQIQYAATADEEGRFALPWEPGGQYLDWADLFAGAEGYVGRVLFEDVPAASPPTEVVLRLEEARPVRVRVRSLTDGRPLAGVELDLVRYEEGWRSAGVTDERGEVRLWAGKAAGGVTLEVLPLGPALGRTVQRFLPGGLPGAEEPVLEIAVQPYPRRVELRAVDARTRLAVPDARFTRVRRLGRPLFDERGERVLPREILPSTDGVLALEDLQPEELPLQFRVEAPGYLPAAFTVVGEAPGGAYELALSREEHMPFQVVRHGEPLPGLHRVEYSMEPIDHALPREWNPAADSWQGAWRFHEPLRGRVTTAADGSGFLPFRASSEDLRLVSLRVVTEDGAVRDYGDLVVPALPRDPLWRLEVAPQRGRVRLLVRGEEGEVLGDARLLLSPAPLLAEPDPREDRLLHASYVSRDLERRGLQVEARAGKDGWYEAELLAPSRLAGSLEWEGREFDLGQLTEAEVRPGAVTSVEIDLGALLGMEIAGRLTVAGGALPRAFHAELEALWVDGPGEGPAERRFAEVDPAHGSFRFPDLPPGRYEIVLLNYPDGPRLPAQTGDRDLVFEIPGFSHLAFEVVDSLTGEFVDNPEVYLICQEEVLPVVAGLNDGRVVFHNLAARVDEARFWRPGYLIRSLDLRAADQVSGTPIRVALEPGRVLRLRYVDALGRPVRGLAAMRVLAGAELPEDDPELFVYEDGDDGGSRFLWATAPRGALRLQGLDAEGHSFGPVIEIPAGAGEVDRRIVVPEAAPASGR